MGEVLDGAGDQRCTASVPSGACSRSMRPLEEEIVHPAAKKYLPDGAQVVAARLKEENKAKKTLTELEAMDLNSDAFETRFEALQTDVLAHAESEENEEDDALASKLEPRQLEGMRKAVDLAESMAPTRMHAGVESAAGNILMGPFVAMLNRARDALSGKSPKS